MLFQMFLLTDESTGETIGSTAIDLEFEILANNRLEQANRQHPMGINVEDAAYTMMKSKEYLNAKVCLNSCAHDKQVALTRMPVHIRISR